MNDYNYNIFYSDEKINNDITQKLIKNNIIKFIQACDSNCTTCKEWNKIGQGWKFDTFSPVHCAFCYVPGYPDDFIIFDGLKDTYMLCTNCKIKYIKLYSSIKNIIYREQFGKFNIREYCGMFV